MIKSLTVKTNTTGKRCLKHGASPRHPATGRCIKCQDLHSPATIKLKHERNKELLRRINRKRRGLPDPTREEPAACECCGGPPGIYGMHLDHCHITEVFRGWLCMKCNSGIGLLGDNITGLINGILYLARQPSKSLDSIK